jgi:hypothetical protein
MQRFSISMDYSSDVTFYRDPSSDFGYYFYFHPLISLVFGEQIQTPMYLDKNLWNKKVICRSMTKRDIILTLVNL